jgi:mono/diheme cytochrome c family protein
MNLRSIQTAKVAVIAAFALSALFMVTTAGADAAPAELSTESSSQAGLYRANCARCHGADGHSNTPAGRETDADDLTTGKVKGMAAARMAQIIKNGKGDMPSFKKLSAAQINGLVRYVKSL